MYPWAKAAHIVTVVVWMAGMFATAHRLASDAEGTDDIARLRSVDATWTISAMSLAWMLGFWMATQARWWIHGWFVAKFCVVFSLAFLHGKMAAALRARQQGQPAALWHRHLPGLLLLCVAVVATLVVVKPF